MKQNVKKWLGVVLTLLIAFPVLAQEFTPSQLAQEKLENKIYSLLRQGKYEKVKTTLVNISVCPRDEKVTEKQIPATCTLNKFDPNPFKMNDSETTDVNIHVNLPGYSGYTKEVTLTVVRPVLALKNALSREYSERFGKDISEYYETGYLQFPETYKGSWLENVVPSFLAEQIWKELQDNHADNWWWKGTDMGKAFYYDAKWHEAQGYDLNKPEDYDKVSELKYAFIPNKARYAAYEPFSDHDFDSFNDFFGAATYRYYRNLRETAKSHDDEDFFIRYKQRVYYKLFTMDSLPVDYDLSNSSKGFPTDYVTLVFIEFSRDSQSWERYAVKDMPENLLKEMQFHFNKNFPTVFALEKNYIQREFDATIPAWWNMNFEEYYQDFIQNAKEYGLWTKETQKKYDELLGEEKKQDSFLNRAWRRLERRLNEIQNTNVDLDNMEFAN